MRNTLVLLLCSTIIAAAQPPSTDSLINHALAIVDIPAFEWTGTPDAMKPRLGMYFNYLPADSVKLLTHGKDTIRGNRIWHISPHWSADEAGMLEGDVVLRVNGRTLEDSVYGPDDVLNTRVSDMHAGDKLHVEFLRDGEIKQLDIPLITGARTPMPVPAAARLGTIRDNTWLQQTLASNAMTDYANTIEKQMRVVADQDYCTVPFANRPSPFRLGAITYLHHHPTRVGAYSRMIDQDIWDGVTHASGFTGALNAAAGHLDISPIEASTFPPPTSRATLNTYFAEVQSHLSRAFASAATRLDSVSQGVAAFLDMNGGWEEGIDTMKNAGAKKMARTTAEKRLAALLASANSVDYAELVHAGQLVALLVDTTWIRAFADSLTRIADDDNRTFLRNFEERYGQHGVTLTNSCDGVDGSVLGWWDTPLGRCVIGGRGANRYHGDFLMIIDVGGDDVYDLPSCKPGTFRFIADLAGNDLYTGERSAASGVGCVDVLVDLAGNDTYRGGSWSQGAASLGVGILADFAGDDVYTAHWCSQGAGELGIGMLYDHAGSDSYASDVYSQGFAYVKGFGALLDNAGNDSYRAGWKYEDSRYPNRAHLSMSQGFGYGMRPWTTGVGTDGGIGLLSDRQGDDLYASDYFSQGGSYWYALGILHDWQGADRYTAGQYSQGSGIHLSFGALLDDAGDDSYDAYAGLEQGNAHDWSGGCLEDWQGNDTYRGSGSSQGSALTVSFAYLLDSHGDDRYYCALSDTTLSQGGGNKTPVRKSGSLGLLLDIGKGSDFYIEQRVQLGTPVLKGNRGFIYDDGKPN